MIWKVCGNYRTRGNPPINRHKHWRISTSVDVLSRDLRPRRETMRDLRHTTLCACEFSSRKHLTGSTILTTPDVAYSVREAKSRSIVSPFLLLAAVNEAPFTHLNVSFISQRVGYYKRVSAVRFFISVNIQRWSFFYSCCTFLRG